MNQKQRLEEINEAIFAGEEALESLKNAKKNLSSASNWGMWDMLGGGLFTNMIKHSKMNTAQSEMETAKRHLRKFKKELQDVKLPSEFQLEVSSFLSFADYFFDGFVADYLVQTKINNAKEQVDDAIHTVQKILQDLSLMKSRILLNGGD